MASAITQLEHDVGLLRVNLNEATALENFLLSSLRIWAKA
jgi:DNA polymerase-3 subunit delta'